MDNNPLEVHPFAHSWPVERLLTVLTSGKAEGRIYGPLDRIINDTFLLRRPHTAQGGWISKPQASLRECQAEVEPPETSEMDELNAMDEFAGDESFDSDTPFSDDADAANVSVGNTTIDSQHNRVMPGRHLAKRPDFAMAYATASMTGDVNHLYIEVKNGTEPKKSFVDQMRRYLRLAIQAIPPTMNEPVYFMLLNGNETHVWTLYRHTIIENADIILGGELMKTMGQEWWNRMAVIADRAPLA